MCNKYYIIRNFKIISKMILSIPNTYPIILNNPRNVTDRISSLNDSCAMSVGERLIAERVINRMH